MNKCMKNNRFFYSVFVSVCSLWLTSFIAVVAAPQPVLYYDFEQQSGSTVTNLGTLGGEGSFVRSPVWVTGTPGVGDGGLEFNGQAFSSASYVDTGIAPSVMGIHNTDSTSAAFTLVAWVKGGKPEIEPNYNDEFVFGQARGDNALHCGIRDQRPHLGLWADDATSYNIYMETGKWYHVVWQLDEDNVQRMFVDGELQIFQKSIGRGIKYDDNIIIGTSTTASRTVDGAVDDVAIYSNVLSVSQIQFLAGGGSPTNLPEELALDDVLFTAPTGPNNTWNLYRVLGANSGTLNSFYEAYQLSTNMFSGAEQGHLVTVHSRSENEFCRYLRNYYATYYSTRYVEESADAWIGLTDSDATNALGVALFAGATESGDTNSVPDLTTRRNNGWVWVNGEAYGSSTFKNWATDEPNDDPSEDAAEIRSDGYWNDIGSGIPGSGDAVIRQLAIIEWDINSPDPVPGAVIREAVLPPSEDLPGKDGYYGSFSGVWVRDAGNIGSTYTAADVLASGDGTVITQDKNIPVIKAYDPDHADSRDRGCLAKNDPFFADQSGVLDNHYVAFYRGKIRIPEGEDGDYTFGVHSGGGFALRFPGQKWKAVYGNGWVDHGDASTIMYEFDTDDSNTRGVISLPAGDYVVEFLSWNDADGRRFHELYAAKGDFASDDDTDAWRLVGHKSIGTISYAAKVSEDWTLWHSENETVGNIDLAWEAVDYYVANASNESTWAEINFYDPQSSGGAYHYYIIPDSIPFPWNTPSDDNTKALYAESTLSIPADTSIGLGFMGDDGSKLTVADQTWDYIIKAAVPSATSIQGDSLVMNSGTANSFSVGAMSLTNGTYDVSILWWEGSGGSYLDVFQMSWDAYNGHLTPDYLYHTLSTTSDQDSKTDFDGLQLIGNEHFHIILY